MTAVLWNAVTDFSAVGTIMQWGTVRVFRCTVDIVLWDTATVLCPNQSCRNYHNYNHKCQVSYN